MVVGDASGKGLAAALMIAYVQSSLLIAALFTGDDLTALLKVRLLLGYALPRCAYWSLTLFYGVFDNTKRTLRYINAG